MEQNQNPYQPEPQGQQNYQYGYNQSAADQVQQVNQAGQPTQGQQSQYPQPAQGQQSPFPQPVNNNPQPVQEQQNPYPQPVNNTQPVQGQQSPYPQPQQPYAQPQQTQPPQQQPQSYQQAQPPQQFPAQGYQQPFPAQGYGQMPAKKKINPLVIILPIVAVILAAAGILLFVFKDQLFGGGNNGGSDSNGNNNNSSNSDSNNKDDDDDDDHNNDHNDDTNLSSQSIPSYNGSNPFSIYVQSQYGDEVNEYMTVKTGDKRKISEAILSYLDREGNLSGFGIDTDDVKRNIDFIVGQPLCLVFDPDDTDGDLLYITYEIPSSLLNSDRYYPDAYVFDGINRFDILTVVYRNGSWEVSADEQYSDTEVGYDEISFGWEAADNKYLVLLDGDALYYALGINPSGGGTDSPSGPSQNGVPDTITIAGQTYRTDMTGTLDLTGMDLYDSDIKDLRYMTNLTEIILSDNYLYEPTVLSELTNLKKLTLHNNMLFNIDFVSTLTNLEVFGAGDNLIEDLSPLSGLTNLTELWLQNNIIEDVSPLRNHTRLRHASFEDNFISDFTPLVNNTFSRLSINNQNGAIYGDYSAIWGLTIEDYFYVIEGNYYDLDEMVEFINAGGIYTDYDGITVG